MDDFPAIQSETSSSGFQKNFLVKPARFDCAGGHLWFEDGVKKQMLFEPLGEFICFSHRKPNRSPSDPALDFFVTFFIKEKSKGYYKNAIVDSDEKLRQGWKRLSFCKAQRRKR